MVAGGEEVCQGEAGAVRVGVRVVRGESGGEGMSTLGWRLGLDYRECFESEVPPPFAPRPRHSPDEKGT